MLDVTTCTLASLTLASTLEPTPPSPVASLCTAYMTTIDTWWEDKNKSLNEAAAKLPEKDRPSPTDVTLLILGCMLTIAERFLSRHPLDPAALLSGTSDSHDDAGWRDSNGNVRWATP